MTTTPSTDRAETKTKPPLGRAEQRDLAELERLVTRLRKAGAVPHVAGVLAEHLFPDGDTRQAFLAAGWDVTRTHFYSPTPDLRELPDALWSEGIDVANLGWDADAQLAWARERTEQFGAEMDWPEQPPRDAPTAYYLDNQAYRSGDAEPCYLMMRSLKPRRVIELGSGMSSKLIASALERNRAEGHAVRYDVYDLYPEDHIGNRAVPGVDELHKTAVQSLPLSIFDELEAGDVLFIDTSHVLRIGSDVQYEYCRILPRVKPGVIVHIHDIFMPLEYPKHWITDNNWCWNEQYLVQAMLANGPGYETIYAAAFMWRERQDELAAIWKHFDPKRCLPAALWLRKTADAR
jgi:predicted O-methyltransferase YrrM